MIAAVCTFLALLAVPTLQQNQDTPASPCPDLFRYEPSSSQPGKWYGVIDLSTDVILYGLWLNIVLDEKADMIGNKVGAVSTSDNMNFKIENSKLQILPGAGQSVRFFVQYNPSHKTPRLSTIRLNGKEICNAATPQLVIPPEPEQLLEAVLAEPFKVSRRSRSTNSGSSSDNFSSEAEYKSNKTPNEEVQCGKVVLTPKVLSNGTASLEGQWPWQATVFYQGEYKGAGSLITDRHIITGAFTVTEYNTVKPLDTKLFVIYLGGENLQTSKEGVQIHFVEKIIIHANYTTSHFYNVAVMKLQESVTFSNWVRPVCLWPDNMTDLKNIVGKKGTVVERSFKTSTEAKDELCLSEMPIVDKATCIRSHSSFYLRYVSYKHYCAGNRDGTDCRHVAGGGMYLKLGESWYLRGQFNNCYAPNGGRCDVTHYSIYTDLAKYLPWIRENISL